MPAVIETFENLPIASVTPDPRNPRVHSKRQVAQIARSMEEFGFVNPIIIDETGKIIAGHGRLQAAQLLGLQSLPSIRLRGLSELQKRTLLIADNKIAENAAWDRELLARELEALVSLDVDLELTGFEVADFDILVGSAEEEADGADAADEACEPDPNTEPVSLRGDLWILGEHRLICGDALVSETYQTLLRGELAQGVVADFPYNVPIAGHVSGLGKVRHREFAMASGEMSEAEFVNFLKTIMALLASVSADGSLHYLFMDWRHLGELLTAARSVYSEQKNLCIWSKTNAGMGSLYRSQHELVAVFKNGAAPHINNVELGKRGRYRTNVWRYAGVNTFRKGRREDLEAHPTVKPIRLVADAICDSTRPGGLVLDPVAGSGTTILACVRAKRRAAAIEIDPQYVDIAIGRFEALTGIKARHADSGLTFSEIAAQRTSEGRDA